MVENVNRQVICWNKYLQHIKLKISIWSILNKKNKRKMVIPFPSLLPQKVISLSAGVLQKRI